MGGLGGARAPEKGVRVSACSFVPGLIIGCGGVFQRWLGGEGLHQRRYSQNYSNKVLRAWRSEAKEYHCRVQCSMFGWAQLSFRLSHIGSTSEGSKKHPFETIS